MRDIKLTPPNVSEREPGRYGRSFYEASVGFGRIDEAPPANMDPDANVVGRVIARFGDREDLPDIDASELDATKLEGAPIDLWSFRRQIIHGSVMAVVVDQCIEAAVEKAAVGEQA
ncbi:MAG: hypothetical protein ACREJM_07795 [Candidatus Saccharimonadales bacterium]